MSQVLFLSTQSRRDIQTSVAILTERVKQPGKDDWFKLRRYLKYLKITIGLKLTLTADALSVIKWWVDASYRIHDDCKFHTGAVMTIGEGDVTNESRDKKIQGKISIED